MTASKKKTLLKVLRYGAIITAFLILASFITTKIVYDSCFGRYDPVYVENTYGTEYKFECENHLLRGYLISPIKNDFDALIVVATGFRSASAEYEPLTSKFAEAGFGVFIFDSTGHAQSEGESSVGFAQEVKDLDAALNFIEENDFFGYSDILLFGHSRGGFAVCCMEEYDHTPTAVISVNGINSSMEATMLPAVKYVGDIAYSNYPMLKLYQNMLFGSELASLSASECLDKTQTPTLVIHSTDDETVPSERFSIISHKDEISSKSVIFNNTLKGSHSGIIFNDKSEINPELFEEIISFFEKAVIY